MPHYTTQQLVHSFDYAKMQSKITGKNENAVADAGICTALSSMWLQLMIQAPTTGAKIRMTKLETEGFKLVACHQEFGKRTKNNQHLKGHESLLGTFNLRTEDVNKDNTYSAVANRYAPKGSVAASEWNDATAWMSRKVGDFWGLIYTYLQSIENLALVHFKAGSPPDQNKGHTIGISVNNASKREIRLFDMNAGEFTLAGENQWNNWVIAADGFYSKDPHFGALTEAQIVRVQKKT